MPDSTLTTNLAAPLARHRVRRGILGMTVLAAVAALTGPAFARPALGAAEAVRPVLDAVPAETTLDVAARDDYFEPAVVTVTVASVVRWTNRGDHIHSTTSDDAYWDWTLVPGASFSVRFLSPGTFRYHCKYHRGAGGAGSIVVVPETPGGSPTPTPWLPPTPGPTPTPTPTSWFVPTPTVTPVVPYGDEIVFDYFASEIVASRTDLFAVSPDGSGRRQITNTPSMSEAQPSWSPDRRRIAYSVTVGDPKSGPWQLAVADLSTGRASAITAGRHHYEPDWRPDGSLIAFTSLTLSGDALVSSELAIVAPDGAGYRSLLRLDSPFYAVGNPSWSPDGSRIAFTLESGTAGGELYVLDATTGAALRLLDHPGWDDIDPAWSPDGHTIAFASGVSRGSTQTTTHSIWLLDVQTGASGAIVAVPDWDLRGPAWSGDGREIVFSARFQVNPSRWALYVVPAAGGAVRGALSVGVEPDWGGASLVPLPTPMPGATATSTPPPAPPTFPPPPTDLPPPFTPGPSPTPPLPPTYPAPTLVPVEPTPTIVPSIAPTVEVSSTPPEPTPSPQPTALLVHHIYVPRAYDTIGAH